MAQKISRLRTAINNNPFISLAVVTGVVASMAIVGVIAWTNNAATVAVSNPATTQKQSATKTTQDKKDAATKQTDQSDQQVAIVAGSQANNEGGAVLGMMTPQPSTSKAMTVAASNSSNNAVAAAPAPAPAPAPAANPAPAPTPTPVQPTPSPTPTPPVVTPPTPTPTPTPTPSDPSKFDKARVSLTFDDGWKSIHNNGLPLLKKYGLTSTQYINAQPTMEGYSGYYTPQDIQDFATANHEIAWHTNTHQYDLTQVDAATMNSELKPRLDFLDMLMSINVTLSDNFASPFGTQNAATIAAVKANGFNSYRTTDDGYNLKGSTDVMSIKVKNVCGAAGIEACNGLATTPAQVAAWVAEAQTNNAWLVIVFHEVAEFSRATATANGTSCDADPTEAGVKPDDCVADPSYAVTPANLDAELSLIKQSGVDVVTVDQALSQLATSNQL